jgi:hypothetical protein
MGEESIVIIHGHQSYPSSRRALLPFEGSGGKVRGEKMTVNNGRNRDLDSQ